MVKGRQNKDMGKRKTKQDKKYYVGVCPVCGYERTLELRKYASCPTHNRLLAEKEKLA